MTRGPDDDLKYAFEYNDTPFEITDIEDVLACIAGHNDEDNWYWIVRLRDGRFFLIDAWCDYTGWGCQDGVTCYEASSPEDATNRVVEPKYGTKRNIAAQLLKQLRGEQPFGLEIREVAK